MIRGVEGRIHAPELYMTDLGGEEGGSKMLTDSAYFLISQVVGQRTLGNLGEPRGRPMIIFNRSSDSFAILFIFYRFKKDGEN